MRQLKNYEQKLLKKVDLFSWKYEQNVREASVIRKYRLQKREDYVAYSRTVGNICKLVAKLKLLKLQDPVRIKCSDNLLQKLSRISS